jgi:hypothetical protein
LSWLKRLVAGFSLRRPGFAPGSVHVGFVVDKVALGQAFLRVFRFSSARIRTTIIQHHKGEQFKLLSIIITTTKTRNEFECDHIIVPKWKCEEDCQGTINTQQRRQLLMWNIASETNNSDTPS